MAFPRSIGRPRPAAISPRQTLVRGAAALSLLGAMTLSALTASSTAVAQDAATGISPAAIAPADSILYVGFSLDTESPQWSLVEELLQRAGVEETGSDILGDVSAGATGQEIADAEAFLGGDGAFVVTSIDALTEEAGTITDMAGLPSIDEDDATGTTSTGIAEPAGWAFIIEPSDPESAAQQLEDEIDAESGVQVTETEYSGTTIRSAPANEATGDSGFAYAVVDGFIVLAETPEDLERIIDAATGDAQSLADVEPFNQASEALPAERIAFGYLDTTSLADDVAELDTSGLGLGDSLSELAGTEYYTGVSVGADPAGFRFETVQIPAEPAAERSEETEGNPTFAEEIPADTLVMASGYDLGAGVLLQGLGLALVTAVNQGVSSMTVDEGTPVPMPTADELYEQAAALLGFNLRTDFIDQLVGEYGFALWGADAADPSQISAVLTSGVESPATLADTLSKLSFLIQAGAQGQANVTTRAVGDYNINTLTVPQDGGDPIVVEYGIVDGEFVLGFGNGIDAYLSETDPTLAESEDFQTAMSALPAEYDGILYIDVEQAMALSESATAITGDAAFTDDPELCGQYSTQAAAQEAYDADPVANFEMDWDFDGVACEDFFLEATPEASPVAVAADSPIDAFAGVSYEEDGLKRTSSILVISEE